MITLHKSQAKVIKLPGRTIYSMVGFDGIENDKMTFGVAELPAKSKMDSHKHVNEVEIIYIIEGFGKLYLEDGNFEPLEPGTVIVAPKNINHSIENESSNVMQWCFCFNPPVRIGEHAK